MSLATRTYCVQLLPSQGDGRIQCHVKHLSYVELATARKEMWRLFMYLLGLVEPWIIP